MYKSFTQLIITDIIDNNSVEVLIYRHGYQIFIKLLTLKRSMIAIAGIYEYVINSKILTNDDM